MTKIDKGMFDKIHKRFDYLLSKLPRYEAAMDQIIESMEAGSKDISPKDLLKLYLQVFNVYSKSLDMIRQILAYVPIEHDSETLEFLTLFNTMDESERETLLSDFRSKRGKE